MSRSTPMRWHIHGTGTISDEEWNRGEILERGQPYLSAGPQLDPFEVVKVMPVAEHDEIVARLVREWNTAMDKI